MGQVHALRGMCEAEPAGRSGQRAHPTARLLMAMVLGTRHSRVLQFLQDVGGNLTLRPGERGRRPLG